MPDTDGTGLSPVKIREVLRAVVREELKANGHTCRFSISDKEANQLSHLIGMMSYLGDGRIESGIEIIRDNHKWLRQQRELGTKISSTILVVFVTSVVAGVLSALWFGLKAFIGKS